MDNVIKTDPLGVILVDESTRQDRARELLAFILKGRAEINSITGELNLLPDAYSTSVANTILILLCGKLAQKLLFDKKIEIDEKMSQGQIVEFLNTIELGTIKSSLHNLRKEYLVKNESGKNFVAIPQLEKIRNKVTDKSSDIK